MKTSMKLLAAVIAGLGFTTASLTAYSGQGKSDHDESAAIINKATFTLDQATSIALSDVPGRVIEAKIDSEDNKVIWEIEVLDAQNQIYEFEIDATTGEILDKDKEDS